MTTNELPDFQQLKDAFYKQFPNCSVRNESATWCYAATSPKYNEYVHYELIKRGSDFYVEFHVETYANGRDNLVEELRSQFPSRQFLFSTYYSSRIWQIRIPVITIDDLNNDIKQIRDIVEPIIGASGAKEQVTTYVPVELCPMTLADLLKEKLSIPTYQRGYCWRKRNILCLLEDIKNWQDLHRGEEDVYHIGTVILKAKKDGYEIIDGQQRLTTLAMLDYFTQNDHQTFPLLKATLGNNNETVSSRNHLLWARKTIQQWPGILNFSRIQLSVVVLGENVQPGLEFNFFSSTNSAGKRLSDYDLLKTHHLRYIADENTARIMAQRWHALEKKEDQQSKLLHEILYRLRCWRQKEFPFLDADRTQERHLFNHYAVAIDTIARLITQPQPLRFDSILSGGLEFFTYVEAYRKKYEEFVMLPIVTKMEETFRWESNGTLLAGMKALAFLFYSKFGDMYLSEAIYVIVYRISSLRNNSQVRRCYLSKENIFSQCTICLDRVTHESDFLAWMLNPADAYRVQSNGPTADRYWEKLKVFLQEHEKLQEHERLFDFTTKKSEILFPADKGANP